MKVTGYRSLTTHHDWGRAIGDANGHIAGTRTDAPVPILETNSGLESVGLGPHSELRLGPASGI